jgi:hypothetical protein
VQLGTILFCGKDVCDALGIVNRSDALAALRVDEKADVGITDIRSENGVVQRRNLTFITEPGLYRLVFKSRKAEAVIFQDWVFHEVLPSIRKNGAYTQDHSAYVLLIRDQIALGVSPDIAAKGAYKLVGCNPRPIPVTHNAHPLSSDLQDIIDIMVPGVHHGIDEIALALPKGHHIKTMSDKARYSHLGSILKAALLAGHVERHKKHRRVYYSLPVVIPFALQAD